MRASTPLLASVLIAMVVAASPTSAPAYCTEGVLKYPGSSTTRHDIPVYLYAPNGIIVGQLSPIVEHEIEMAVDHWHEASGAGFRPYYAGLTTSTSSNGRIVIREDQVSDGSECSTGGNACAEHNVDWAPPFGIVHVGETIWLMDEGTVWSHAKIATVVTHELGHGFGLDDTYAGHCSNALYDRGGVMGSSTMYSTASLGLDDQLGMQALYGERVFGLAYFDSADMVTWPSMWRSDPTLLRLRYPLGSSTSDGPRERIGYAFDEGAPVEVASVCDNAQCSDVDLDELPSYSATRNLVSVAAKSSMEWMVVYTRGDTQFDGTKIVEWAITEDGGASFETSLVLSGSAVLTTPFAGVTATYDPRTDRYVVALRRSDWRITIAAIQAEAPHGQGAVSNTPWIAWRTPNVECTQPMFVNGSGSNCLVVWAGDGAFHYLRHAIASISSSTGTPTVGLVASTLNKGYGAPALTETRRTDYPWLIAAESHNSIRAWRRTSNGTWASGVTVAPTVTTRSYLPPSLARVDDGSGTPVFHLRWGLD